MKIKGNIKKSLKIKRKNIEAGRPIIFLHEKTAQALQIAVGERALVEFEGKKIVAIVDRIDELSSSEIIISKELQVLLSPKTHYLTISRAPYPKSLPYILKKMHGLHLQKEELKAIMEDITQNALVEAEVAYFVSAVYERGMTFDETLFLTEAVFSTGAKLNWGKKEVADKHCIGGIAGNRTTPLVVSICAAAGITIPKTSSRAITSAAGTADVMETLTRVDLSARELQAVVRKTGACLAWGGSLGLAPADDKLIRVERLLNVDPEAQLIASILAKKIAAGSRNVLIDIPYGFGAKVSYGEAKALGKQFIAVGKKFNLRIKILLTDGSQPIGNGVGPNLEMRDVLSVLNRNDSPQDLETKALLLAGTLLEMTGKAKKGQGKRLAKDILYSGKALRKFEEIITAQGKKENDLRPGKYSFKIVSSFSGKIKSIDNKGINHAALLLGCPSEKEAGIFLLKHVNAQCEKAEPLAILYSESLSKLEEAKEFWKTQPPITFTRH
ncbi:MAG: thymidine phosphorylase family protein [Nanoarchaeota archaeon]